MFTCLVEGVARDVRGDVVRSVFFYELDDARNVAYFDLGQLLGDGLDQLDVVRQMVETNTFAETREAHQDVAVVAVHEGGVDAEIPGHQFGHPASGERAPRPLEPFETEVPEVGLQELAEIVAELEVEVPVEDDLPADVLPRVRDEVVDVLEDVNGRLAEEPRLVRVVEPRHDLHADAEVPEAVEDVDGPAGLQLVVVAGARAAADAGSGSGSSSSSSSVGAQSDDDCEQQRSTPHSRRDWDLTQSC